MKTLRVNRQPTSLHLISDCHVEAASTDLDALRRDLQDADARGSRILLGGDIFDAIYPGDKRWTPTTLRRELRDTDDIVGEVLAFAESIFQPYAHLIDLISPGNHEARLRDKINADMTRQLAQRLGVTYGPYAGVVEYKLAQRKTLRVGYWHGSGGGTSIQAAVRQSQRILDVAEVLDVAWTGHRHQRFAMPVGRFGDRGFRKTWLVMSGAYSRWEGYATEKLCPAGDVGGVLVRVGSDGVEGVEL